MTLSILPGVQISYATRVSRNNKSTLEQSKSRCLFQDSNPIFGQSDSKVSVIFNKKRELSPGLVLQLKIHVLVLEN